MNSNFNVTRSLSKAHYFPISFKKSNKRWKLYSSQSISLLPISLLYRAQVMKKNVYDSHEQFFIFVIPCLT